jgi:hypothetical protein
MGGDMEYRRARRRHATSPAVLDYERKRRQFQLIFDRDGAFRINDVPPGTYELRLRALEPLTAEEISRGIYRERAEIASLIREVVVPSDGTQKELDLGTLQVTAKIPAGPTAAKPALALPGTTLDGKPLDLAKLRGRPAVVMFWANWAPQSGSRLAELQAAAARSGGVTNVALVGINLDDDPAAVRQSLERIGAGWTHARLDGAARFDLTEQLGIDTLPASFLIDANGAVIARDPSGRRLAAVLSRLSNTTPRP